MGARRSGDSGSAQPGMPPRRSCSAVVTSTSAPSRTWFDDDGGDVGVLLAHARHGGGGTRGDVGRRAAAGGDDEHHRGAEVGGDRGVGGELGGVRDPGEVGADDEHGVVPAGDLVVAVDHGPQRPVRVAPEGLVRHSPAALRREVGGRLLDEDGEQLVGEGTRPHDRPEDTHAAVSTGQLAARGRGRRPTCPSAPRCRRGRGPSRAHPTHRPSQLGSARASKSGQAGLAPVGTSGPRRRLGGRVAPARHEPAARGDGPVLPGRERPLTASWVSRRRAVPSAGRSPWPAP